MRIPLTNSRLFARIDSEDFEKVSQLKWYLDEGYAVSTSHPKLKLHHLVFGKPRVEVDHRSTDKLDCRKRNLREANKSQNGANKHKYKNNSTGFKGVHFSRIGNYEAAITKDGKMRHLGTFDSPIEAAKAYDRAARKLHGEFARPNFPMRFPR